MVLPFVSLSPLPPPQFSLSLKPPSISLPSLKPRPFLSLIRRCPLTPFAIAPDSKFYPNPSDDDPPEADEDSMHGVSKFQQIHRQAARARKVQEEEFKKDQSVFLNAIADVEDAPDDPSALHEKDSSDDLFGEIDKAIALKRKEFVKQGLLKPNPKKVKGVEATELEGIEELLPEVMG